MNDNEKSLGRVVFLHGIRTPKRSRRLHRLARAFRREGFCVLIPSYGYVPAFLAGIAVWLDRRLADSIAPFIEEDDILVGHSNGATLAYMIAKRVKLRGVVLINAALDSSVVPNAGFSHVYYNEGDWVVRLAGWLPFHLWGDMGSSGYTGQRQGVKNIDCARPPMGLPTLWGHSDIFTPAHLRPWSHYMALLCVQEAQEEDRKAA